MSPRFRLAKVPLCLLIGCSTIFGYILADPYLKQQTFLSGFGIFTLATGAASLNSLQEYRLDAQLKRTKNRPLPMGELSLVQAGVQAFGLLILGLVILFAVTNRVLPVLFAGIAVLLYNALYTPLKKKTILAILPGAICGSLPPYIGWLGGGGQAVSFSGALLIVLFILWQVPHFFLVLLTFQNDYQKSSLPSLLKMFRESTLKRFFVTWIGALVLIMFLFLTLPFPLSVAFQTAIIFNGSLLLLVFSCGLAIPACLNYRMLFMVLNIALFMHMMIIAAGRVYAANTI